MPFPEIKEKVEEYITLNDTARETIQKMIELLQEKRGYLLKHNKALHRVLKAIEMGNEIEAGASWLEARRWKLKAHDLIIGNIYANPCPTPSKE